jgi:hypothetical protein
MNDLCKEQSWATPRKAAKARKTGAKSEEGMGTLTSCFSPNSVEDFRDFVCRDESDILTHGTSGGKQTKVGS